LRGAFWAGWSESEWSEQKFNLSDKEIQNLFVQVLDFTCNLSKHAICKLSETGNGGKIEKSFKCNKVSLEKAKLSVLSSLVSLYKINFNLEEHFAAQKEKSIKIRIFFPYPRLGSLPPFRASDACMSIICQNGTLKSLIKLEKGCRRSDWARSEAFNGSRFHFIDGS
jgi:hypothetical protein